ncbi:30S ribosomal protein S6 [Blastopirellula marina]|uniref:Small ribosomal subunit protein bS6 n=1 Tax=Blastopirellula marina TaxID=124 RepID=A0A2S8FTF1_9BACT|nr:30S ribosomal protein S6 [Blastopirellula marina]PQO35459.1 30S ribosomal protein S6 [Blastopirellula marina]PQO41369.1 30S ribosomal protein S6 [Blastopirellula marina]PTL44099.1 30S ribosomal protein S6 [Blastopirellula marina]
MAANVYEGLFILDSNRYARDPSGVAGQIQEHVEKLGGEILVSRMWIEQRLAYPINGHRKGTYWLTYFRLESTKLTDLTYQCNINDNFLRFLFVKHDPRIVDMLVAHADGSAVEAPEGEEAGAEEGEPAAAE